MNDQEHTTQEALLQAAEELFAERGFADVGNREITAKAGANLSAIKYHFGSKQGLYDATVERVLTQPDYLAIWAILKDAPEDREGAACCLATFLHRLIAKLFAEEGLDNCSKLMMREALRPTVSAQEAFVEHMRSPDEAFGNVLGTIAPDLSPADLMIAGWGVVSPVFHIHLFRNLFELQVSSFGLPPIGVEQLATVLIRMILRGLGCDEEMIARAIAHAAHQTSHEADQ